jgi:hypothetical protein
MLRAERFTLERNELYEEPVLAVQIGEHSATRLLVVDPKQLFLEVVSVLGPWLQQPGVLPDINAGGELFDQFRDVMSDMLDVEKEEK